ncbi:MAG TPA: Hsp20/alpha crystallin family protein [Gemmatimonadaceae bacterium]|nr:Hsp20/alpha crystallin family protein [Gemmatimonadaceae bacterium]
MATRNPNRNIQDDQPRGNDASRRGMSAAAGPTAGGREEPTGRQSGGGTGGASAAGTGATSSRGTAQNSGASATGATGTQTGVPSNSGGTSSGQSSARAGGGQGTESPRTDRERGMQTTRETGTSRSSGTTPQRGQTQRQGGTAGGLAPRGNVSPVYGGYGSANPFTTMRRMMDDMDRLFSNVGIGPALLPSNVFGLQDLGTGEAERGLRSLPQGIWSPQIETFERGNDLVVRADLPGLNRDDVDVEIDNDTLILRGERQNEHENTDQGYYQSERSYGSFYRAIPLPEGADANACNATFKDGVLEVTIPLPQQQGKGRKKVQIT